MPPRDPLIQLDDAPQEPAANFGAWAPHVLGHLQRIESSLSYQSRTMAVLETKFDNFSDKLEHLEKRVTALEKDRADASIQDASRVGMLVGIKWLWGVIVAGGGMLLAAMAYIISNLPPK